ncbi:MULTISPECIES: hypothetical protein [unclassified Streptomyces]|uniref:hypothetical protein n=1 Tax=unclassified Streptomyces TaxID=2593676 RepID=UPI0037F9EB4E
METDCGNLTGCTSPTGCMNPTGYANPTDCTNPRDCTSDGAPDPAGPTPLTAGTRPLRVTVVVVDDRDRGGLLGTFEELLGLPANLLQPVPDTANRSLALAETEMLRTLNKEFRGNGLPDELYSRLIRNGAVMHMKNRCSPASRDVKIPTPDWAVRAAAGIGAEMAGRIELTRVRVIGDPALLSAVPKSAGLESGEARIAPEVAAQALYGALAAAAASPGVSARAVHQASSKELVRVLGHRCLERLGRR